MFVVFGLFVFGSVLLVFGARARYPPQENKRNWEDDCRRICGDKNAVPFIWKDVLQKLRSMPAFLDHFLTNAHAKGLAQSRL